MNGRTGAAQMAARGPHHAPTTILCGLRTSYQCTLYIITKEIPARLQSNIIKSNFHTTARRMSPTATLLFFNEASSPLLARNKNHRCYHNYEPPMPASPIASNYLLNEQWAPLAVHGKRAPLRRKLRGQHKYSKRDL